MYAFTLGCCWVCNAGNLLCRVYHTGFYLPAIPEHPPPSRCQSSTEIQGGAACYSSFPLPLLFHWIKMFAGMWASNRDIRALEPPSATGDNYAARQAVGGGETHQTRDIEPVLILMLAQRRRRWAGIKLQHWFNVSCLPARVRDLRTRIMHAGFRVCKWTVLLSFVFHWSPLTRARIISPVRPCEAGIISLTITYMLEPPHSTKSYILAPHSDSCLCQSRESCSLKTLLFHLKRMVEKY